MRVTLSLALALSLAIYVTGQGSRPNREAKIASIAQAIYQGYDRAADARQWVKAGYGGPSTAATAN